LLSISLSILLFPYFGEMNVDFCQLFSMSSRGIDPGRAPLCGYVAGCRDAARYPWQRGFQGIAVIRPWAIPTSTNYMEVSSWENYPLVN
jgi:hypothetical protein